MSVGTQLSRRCKTKFISKMTLGILVANVMGLLEIWGIVSLLLFHGKLFLDVFTVLCQGACNVC